MIPDDNLELHKGMENAINNKYVGNTFFSFLALWNIIDYLKIYHENTNLQKGRVAILISDKDFKTKQKNIVRNKEKYFIIIKVVIEDIIILNLMHLLIELQNP